MASPNIEIKADKITLGPIPVRRFNTLLETHLSGSVKNVIEWSHRSHFLIFKQYYIDFHPFFALEFYQVFKILGEHHAYFKLLANLLETKTWIASVIVGKEPLHINWSILDKQKIVLESFQKEFINRYATYVPKYNLKGNVLAFEQGLGKSITSISLMLAREKDRVVIVCPKSLIPVWKNELENVAHIDPKTITTGNRPSAKTKWLITNYEAIGKISPAYYQKANTGLILDESQYIKELRSQRTQATLFMIKNSQIDDILLLSGTPIKGDINEWLPYLLILDPMIDEALAKQLVNAFFTDPKVIEHIASVRLGIYVSRELKSKRLKLPPKEIRDIKVRVNDVKRYTWPVLKKEMQKLLPKLTKELTHTYKKDWKRIYEILKEKNADWKDLKKFSKLMSDIKPRKDKEEQIDKIINKWMNLLDKKEDRDALWNVRMAVVNFVAHVRGKVVNGLLVQRRVELVTNIVERNIDTICELISLGNKKSVVVGTVIKPLKLATQQIIEKCQRTTSIVTGETPTEDRKRIVDNFRKEKDPRVLVGSIGTIGVGFTLISADTMVVLNPPWRYSDLEQVMDRIHRIGQDAPVKIYIMRLVTKELNIHDHMFQISQAAGKLVEEFLRNIGIIPKDI
jgi:SNF2 family DNA or RNA helicase